MKKKNKKKAILILIGILMLTAAVSLGLHHFGGMIALTASNPAPISKLQIAEADASTLETIADNETPLSGAQEQTTRLDAAPQTETAVVPAKAAAPRPENAVQPGDSSESDDATENDDMTENDDESETDDAADPGPSFLKSNAAIRLLERANALLAEFNACASNEEKRALLGISNSNFSNDTFRAKLLADLGGAWEALEDEIVGATQYQSGNTLYVQVYMSGLKNDFIPVIYSTQNADLTGRNQWATNLIYNEETELWVEYTKKHPYNNSRESYSMTNLGNNEDGWEELKEVMESSPVWEEVIVPVAPAPEAP